MEADLSDYFGEYIDIACWFIVGLSPKAVIYDQL